MVVYGDTNSDGSIIFLGDCGVNACNWLVESYGEALKSDMVQVSHHGCETATAELYDNIAAPTVFWPCSESLMFSYRGELVKQHILEAEYSKEHILHAYGTATRALSYKSDALPLDILPKDAAQIKGSAHAADIRIEDGAVKYTIAGEGTDPFVYFAVDGVDSSRYNAFKMVIGEEDLSGAQLFFKMSTDENFTTENSKYFGKQGVSDDGKMTVIVYLGDKIGYSGILKELRLDLNGAVDDTVEIYSVEAYYVDIDR